MSNYFQKLLEVELAKEEKMAELQPKSVLDHNYKTDIETLSEDAFTSKYGPGARVEHAMYGLQKAGQTYTDNFMSNGGARNTSLVEDFGTAAAIGFGDNLPKLGYGLYGLAGGDMDTVMAGIEEQDRQAEESRKRYSPTFQAAEKLRADAAAKRLAENPDNGIIQNFLSATGEYLANPASIIPLAGESSADLVMMAGTGGIAGAVAKQAAKKGIANMTATEAAKHLAARQAAAVSTTGMVQTGITEGGHNAVGAIQQVMGMSEDEMVNFSPEYLERKGAEPNKSFEQIREEMAVSTGRKVGLTSGVAAAFVGKLTGASDRAAGALLPNSAAQSFKQAGGRILKGGGVEGFEEILQSGGGQAISNAYSPDSRVEVKDGVGDAAAAGFVAGTATGAGLAAATTGVKTLAEEAVIVGGDVVEKGREYLQTKEATQAGGLLEEIDTLLAEAKAATPKKERNSTEEVVVPQEAKDKIESAKVKLKEVEAARDLEVLAGKDTEELEKENADLAKAQRMLGNETHKKKKSVKGSDLEAILNDPNTSQEAKDKAMADFLNVSGPLFQDIEEDAEDPISVETLTAVREKAVAAGKTDAELVNVDRMIKVKSVPEVSEEVTGIGNVDFRGGRYYLDETIRGIQNNSPAAVASNIGSIHKFNTHMQGKVVAFREAMAKSKAIADTNKANKLFQGDAGWVNPRVEVEGYKSLNSNEPQFVIQPSKDSRALAATIENDANILNQLAMAAQAEVDASPIKGDVDNILATKGIDISASLESIAPKAPEASSEADAVVSPEVTTETPQDATQAVVQEDTAPAEAPSTAPVESNTQVPEQVPLDLPEPETDINAVNDLVNDVIGNEEAEAVAQEEALQPAAPEAASPGSNLDGSVESVTATEEAITGLKAQISEVSALPESPARNAELASLENELLQAEEALDEEVGVAQEKAAEVNELKDALDEANKLEESERTEKDNRIQSKTQDSVEKQKKTEKDAKQKEIVASINARNRDLIKVKKRNTRSSTDREQKKAEIFALEQDIKLLNEALKDPENYKIEQTGNEALAQLSDPVGKDAPITQSKFQSDADVEYLSTYNDLREEGSVSKKSLLGNFSKSLLDSGKALISTVYDRLLKADIPEESADDLVKLLNDVGLHDQAVRFGTHIKEFVVKADAKLAGKNTLSRKLSTGYRNLLLDNEGNVLPMVQVAGAVALVQFMMTRGTTLDTNGFKRLAGFGDSKAPLPGPLAKYFMDKDVGSSEQFLVSNLGDLMLDAMGVTFDGTHRNTRSRMRDALGSMLVEYLLDAGIVQQVDVSINEINSKGGRIAREFPEGLVFNSTVGKKTDSTIYREHEVKKEGGKYVQLNIFGTNAIGIFDKASGKTRVMTEEDYSGVSSTIQHQDRIKTYKLNTEFGVGQVLDTSDLKGVGNLIEKAFGMPPKQIFPGVKPPKNNGNIKGQFTTASESSVAAADKNSKIPHTLSERMLEVIDSVPREAVLAMLGWKDVSQLRLLPAVKAAQEVANRDAEKDYDTLMDMRKFLDDSNVEDGKFYYGYSPQPYQRMQVTARTFNAQARLFHRFVSHLPSKPLKVNESGADQVNFYVAVAQAVGIDVDKLAPVSGLTELNEFVGKNREALDNLIEAIPTGITPEVMAPILELAGSLEKTHSLQGIMEYAHYRAAVIASNGNPDATFEVTLAAEIDGLNNGPVTALIQASSDAESLAENLRLGGIMDASVDDRTVATRLSSKDDTPAAMKLGLYEKAKEAMSRNLKAVMGLNPTNALSLQAQITLMRGLETEFEKLTDKEGNPNQFEIERKAAKEIVTPAFYSAQDKSLIASDVRKAVTNIYNQMQAIYERTSEDATSISVEDQKHLEFIFTTVTRTSPQAGGLLRRAYSAQLKYEKSNPSQPQTFGLGFEIPLEVNYLLEKEFGEIEIADGTLRGYSAQNLLAFREEFSDAFQQFELLGRLVGSLGGVAKKRFLEAYTTKLREQAKSKYLDMSKEDFDAMMKKLLPQLPIAMTSLQDDIEGKSDGIAQFKMDGVAGKDRPNELKNLTHIGNDKDFTKINTPISMGSGVAPSMTIPLADVLAVMAVFESGEEAFQIFDGILVNALNMQGSKEAANNGYYGSMINNSQLAIAKDVVDSTLGTTPEARKEALAELSPLELGEMFSNLVPTKNKEQLIKGKNGKYKFFQAYVDALVNKTRDGENKSKFDKDSAAFSELLDYTWTWLETNYGILESKDPEFVKKHLQSIENLVVDQFGSLDGTPHIIKHEVSAPTEVSEPSVDTPPDITLEDVTPKHTPYKRPLSKERATVEAKVGELKNAKTYSEFRNILNAIVDSSEIMSAPHKVFLKQVLIRTVIAPAMAARVKAGEKLGIMLGSTNEIAYELLSDSLTDAQKESLKKGTRGAYDFNNDTVYLNTEKGGNSAETLLHELLHATLDSSLVTKWISSPESKAVLESLTKEVEAAWRKAYPGKHFPFSIAGDKLPDTVKMREIFAWGLTNFNLIQALAGTESQNQVEEGGALTEFAKRLLRLVQAVVQKAMGITSKGSENSILAFMVQYAATAVKEVTQVTIEDDGPLFQDAIDSIQDASPAEVFDSLNSTGSSKHRSHLAKVFAQEIEPLQNSKQDLLKDRADSALEALAQLQTQGMNVSSHDWVGIFGMSDAEEYMFESYASIIDVGIDTYALASTEISDLYAAAKSQLKMEDFLPEGATDAPSKAQAQAQYDAIFNSPKTSANSHLAEFAALTKTNEQFRTILNKRVVAKKNLKDTESTLGNKVLEIGSKVVAYFTGQVTGAQKVKSYARKLDVLTKNLTVAEFTAKSKLQRNAVKALTKGGAIYKKYSDWAQSISKAIHDSETAKVVKKATDDTVETVKDAFVNSDNPKQIKLIGQFRDKLHHGTGKWIPRLIESDFSLTSDANRGLRSMFFMKAKAIGGAADGAVKAARATLLDGLGDTPQTKANMSALTDGMLRTDISVFHGKESNETILRYFADPVYLKQSIVKYKEMLRLHPLGEILINQAVSLGNFQIHNQGTSDYTMPNARAIAVSLSKHTPMDVDDMSAVLDKLATLVAVQETNPETKKRITDIGTADINALDHVMKMHSLQKAADIQDKNSGDEFGALKGGIKELYDPNRDIKVVPRSMVAGLKKDGYTLQGELQRNEVDLSDEPMFIMYSSVGGLSGYQQGDYSTAVNTKGVMTLDSRGISDGYGSATASTREVRPVRGDFLRSLLKDNVRNDAPELRKSGTMAVINSHGLVTGQQYVLSLTMKRRLLGAKQGIDEILPNMFGHTQTVVNTRSYNEKVNLAVHAAYLQGIKEGKAHEFIEVSAKAPTPEGRRAYRMLPPEARLDNERIWGKGNPMFVRSSAFDLTFGTRKVSMANVLRHDSDSPDWAKYLVRNVLGLFFSDASLIKGIVTGETLLEEGVGFIKDLIVVRGITVAINNMISNTVQLVLENEGMTIMKAVRYTVEGLRMGQRYQKNSGLLLAAQYKLSLATDPSERKSLERTIAELEKEQSKNPAQPLIDAGALTAVVEDTDGVSNPYSYLTALGEKVGKGVSKLPDGAQWALGNIAASKQSEWYQAAYRFTQLGDFGSRYAMYKLANERGTYDETTMDRIKEAFVMYDIPSNPYVEYAGRTGTFWFLKYFMRIQGVMLRNLFENPRKVAEFVTLTSVTGVDLSSYLDASFLTNSVFNKFGFMNYAEMGVGSLPFMQIAGEF